MTQPDAALRFLSWLQRGAATRVTTPDAPSAGVRATLPVQLVLGPGEQASTSFELLGPGDITAVDARAIVRVWPPAGTQDAEANYFPLVELDQPDLPWRYTPRTHDGNGRLRPWLALIVLTDAEIAGLAGPVPGRPLSIVTVAAGAPLPPPDQTWAWAHAQISGDDDIALATVLATAPERCVARLLCPRRLDPDTAYTALLVPAFEVGRRAGLRLPVAPAPALTAAWSLTAGALAAPLDLPVYYRWSFRTGDGGDFASLVRRLVARPLPDTVGTRRLDASAPGGGLPAAAASPLALGGALRAPKAAASPALPPGFVSALTAVLNVAANAKVTGGDPVVGPPLYGGWLAQRNALAAAGGDPAWFATLNTDPAWRVAAALGAAVVQGEQSALMASAWAQVAGVREANDRLRKAQLARALGERLHARVVTAAASDDAVVQLAAPVHGHVRAGATSIAALVTASPPRTALASPALRRLRRSRGPLGRRQGRADVAAPPIVARVNDGTYAHVLAATPATSAQLPTYDWLKSHVAQFQLPTGAVVASLPARAVEIAADPVLHLNAAATATLPTGMMTATMLSVAPAPVAHATPSAATLAPRAAIGSATRLDPATTRATTTTTTTTAPTKAVDTASMATFRVAATEFASRATTLAPGETLRRLDLAAMRSSLAAALDPTVAIPAGLRAQIGALVGFAWAPADPIAPIMAYPEFPQPMYAPLAALSPDWLLPGLADVPADTATLAEPNEAFIEAYLVGLNHEMARELLWNDYPTDQRGSYFRQFWDPAGTVAPPVPESARDVTRLDGWDAASALGAHSPRPVPPGTDGTYLVLVVRGEVLRRYPGTIVYAQDAQLAAGRYALGSTQRAPAFGGRLAPDVAFYGFALAEDAARGDGTPANAGWFFVFQEQPGEPKFGLAVGAVTDAGATPASWEALAWPHLAATQPALAAVHYIDLAASLPATTPLELPGGAAWHLVAAAPGKPFARGADHATITYRHPTRVAMHAAQMLP